MEKNIQIRLGGWRPKDLTVSQIDKFNIEVNQIKIKSFFRA